MVASLSVATARSRITRHGDSAVSWRFEGSSTMNWEEAYQKGGGFWNEDKPSKPANAIVVW